MLSGQYQKMVNGANINIKKKKHPTRVDFTTNDGHSEGEKKDVVKSMMILIIYFYFSANNPSHDFFCTHRVPVNVQIDKIWK